MVNNDSIIDGLYNFEMLEDLDKGKVEYIDISLLDENRLNEVYKKRDLQECKQSIIEDGLLNPLIAYKTENRYTLVSGHHRLRAIKELQCEEQKIMFYEKEIKDKVPVLIHPGFENEDDEKLAIYHSNLNKALYPEETDAISKEVLGIYERKYPTKDDKPKGISKREILSELAPFDGKTVERHTNSNPKVIRASSIKNSIKSITDKLNAIDFNKFNESEKNDIKNLLNVLSNVIQRFQDN